MDSSSSVSQEPDWAWLPESLLFLILSELFLLSDMVSFGSVCSHWRSVWRDRFHELNIRPNMFFSRRLPMVLIPTNNGSQNMRNLYSVLDRQVYDLRLPVPYNNRSIGSSHGWLIFIERSSFVITLYNPFCFGHKKGTIHLPPFLLARTISEMMNEWDFFPEFYIFKAVLSADPLSSPDYTVMLVYGEMSRLAYYKSGNETWTYISEDHPIVYDLTYFQGLFHAVNFWGELHVCDLDTNRVSSTSEPVMEPLGTYTRRFIVQSYDGNTLLQAVRLVEPITTPTGELLFEAHAFMVYRLEFVDNLWEWLPMMSLDDGVLFVGSNSSYHVRASDFPGLIPNSIYYTGDVHEVQYLYYQPYPYPREPFEEIVIMMPDETSVGPNPPGFSPFRQPPPVWILPTI